MQNLRAIFYITIQCEKTNEGYSWIKKKIIKFYIQGKNLLKASENILFWKAIHGILMRAPSGALLTSLLPLDIIKSDKANQLILNEICEQNNWAKLSESK